VPLPSALRDRRSVAALYMVDSAMDPRLRLGDLIYIDRRRPPRHGDEVLVALSEPPDHALVRTLAAATPTAVELIQYKPPLRFSLPMSAVRAIYRVIPWTELVDTRG
jgi:phage repressor protein C with HTH and peptisase S24 domain